MSETERPGVKREKYEPPGGGERKSGGSGGKKPNGAEQEQGNKFLLQLTPYVWRPISEIPRRKWLYGRHLIRGFVSATVANGGAGKSRLAVADAAAMTTGKNLLGSDPFGKLKVWYWNAEDPREEIERCFRAAFIHYDINDYDIEDRLIFNSGRNLEIKIAKMIRSTVTTDLKIINDIIEALNVLKIDVWIIDPFVATHYADENNNMAMDAVTKSFGYIAEHANCAIDLVHHIRKLGGAEATWEAARGASAIGNAARSVRTINPMSEDEARVLSDPSERWRYFREDIGKANLAPPSTKAKWRKKVSVTLENGEQERLDGREDVVWGGMMVGGDDVGVATVWEWPNPLDGVTADDLEEIKAAARRGPADKSEVELWQADVQGAQWFGKAVAQVLEYDLDDASLKEKVKGLIKIWLENNVFKVVDGRKKGARKNAKLIQVV